jgi:nucleoside-diphosphate-sugar epimerase
VVGDVTDARAVATLVESAEVVVHLAAYVHRKATSAATRNECHEVNVEGTKRVAEAVAATGGYFVFISTANVYAPSDEPAAEDDAVRPRSVYGQTKLEAEERVRELFRAGLRGAILRPAMVFGPGAPGNLGRLVRLVEGRIVPFVGTGANRKTMAPISRVLTSICAVANDQEQSDGQIFNVGGISLSMSEVVNEIARELQVKPRIVAVPRRPVALLGRLLDRIPGSRLPSVSQMVETFTSSSVIDDRKIQLLPAFRDLDEPLAALRRAIRALSGSR